MVLLGVASCSAMPHKRESSVADPCAILDTLYNECFLGKPFSANGRALIDIDQVRLKGKFWLDVSSSGNVVIEFFSSFMGSHREDLTLALSSDTLRILDRERGLYWEGEEVGALLKDSLGIEVDLGEVIWIATGERPPCQELENVRVHAYPGGRLTFSGGTGMGGFRLVFSGKDKRLEEIVWPVETGGDRTDNLLVSFLWEQGDGKGRRELERVVISLGERRFRVKLAMSEVVER